MFTHGFSILELLLVMAIAAMAGGLALALWTPREAREQAIHPLVETIDRILDDAREHVLRSGEFARIQTAESVFLIEAPDSGFSTRWTEFRRYPMPGQWKPDPSVNQPDPALILPHGRPADAVEWQFRKVDSTTTVRITLYISGELRWQSPGSQAH